MAKGLIRIAGFDLVLRAGETRPELLSMFPMGGLAGSLSQEELKAMGTRIRDAIVKEMTEAGLLRPEGETLQ